MNWKINAEEFFAFTVQQHQITEFVLARHLLSLVSPPPNWEVCQKRLIEQISQAATFKVTALSSLLLFVEALHYVPEALKHDEVISILSLKASAYFRCERFVDWAKDNYLSKQGITP